MPDLLAELVECGLLQFGLFEGIPFKTSLDLLGSYPALMSDLAQAIFAAHPIDHYERLLCTADAVPLGAILSVYSGIPMVYSRGTNRDGASDLVGAYDVGHPTLLITNTWAGFESVAGLIHKAEKVGLQVFAACAIIDASEQPTENLPLFSLLKLSAAVETLAAQNWLPAGQANVVKMWLSNQQ